MAARDAARDALLSLKADEYAQRVAKYPTDRFRKFDLGQVRFELGDYDDAMAQFQSAKDEPKLHVRAALMLGRCFMAEGWFAESIGEYREALQVMEVGDRDRELELRYELMTALMALAREESPDLGAVVLDDAFTDVAREIMGDFIFKAREDREVVEVGVIDVDARRIEATDELLRQGRAAARRAYVRIHRRT